MTTLKEILKYTHQLTFDAENDYDWIAIAEILVGFDDIEKELKARQLLTNNESKEKLRYWQDLFFMEVAEQGGGFIGDESELFERIKKNPLFKENEKFLRQLPKVTTDLGRELLIDEMIANNDADELIPDQILESALKKKSREELRKSFEEWNEGTIEESQSAAYSLHKTNVDSDKNGTKVKVLRYAKYLIAACIVGIVVTIGYNTFNNNKYEFEDNSYVITTEKAIFKDSGLGYVEKGSAAFVELKILSYDDAITADPKASNKLILNSYLFSDKNLKLVLLDNAINVKLIELDKNELYLSYDNKFYRIEPSKSFKKLENINDKDIIEQLDRIIYENE